MAGALLLAGCGGTRDAQVATPNRVPRGAVAIVGAAPVTTASFEHWLPIVQRTGAAGGSAARGRPQAVDNTVSFLVKAQWLLQESRAEGIDTSVLNKLVAQRTAQAQPRDGMTSADFALQARLDVIADALQSRHTYVPVDITATQVARYYAAHRAQFVRPASRPILVVATETLVSALAARAALLSGRTWATVAKQYSIEPSKLNGGRSSVVESDAAPVLERAVFAAKQGRIVGPLRIRSESSRSGYSYYIVEATSTHTPSSQRPLTQVASQIRQTLTEQLQRQAWASFSNAYTKRWTARTLCAVGYVVQECRNYPASGASRGS
ncbi:MAG: peptidylprolyl isomerase [Solirubrobacteraceae bacterium]